MRYQFWAGGFGLALVTILGLGQTQANELASPDLSPIQIPKRLLVLTPHPDDASLSAGLIARVLATGGQVRILGMTCGDGSNPINIGFVERQGFHRDSQRSVNYGYYRQSEDIRALALLGVERGQVIYLGLPDSGMWSILTQPERGDFTPYRSKNTKVDRVPYDDAIYPQMPYLYDVAVEQIAKVIRDFEPDMISMTHPNDHHPDHAATWWFGSQAIEKSGIDPTRVRVVAPFDLYAGDLPQELRRRQRLVPPRHRIPSRSSWLNLELTPAEEELKIAMIQTYRSQMAWEHPTRRGPYHGGLTYMLGYVAQNELYATVADPVRDEKFRKWLEIRITTARSLSLVGNVFTDFFRGIFGL